MKASDRFKVTRRSLDALRPVDRSARGMWHGDRELPGFHVVAYETGETAFAVRYRVHGIRRAVRLGFYPSVTPEDARKQALSILGAAARGEDEAARRRALRHDAEEKAKRITFGKWRADYVKDAVRRLKSTRDPERYLEIAGEVWDARPMAEITPRDVESLRNRLAEKRNRRAEKATTQANRWLANVRASLSHAVRLGYIETNPAARVPLLKENAPRTRTLSEGEEKQLRAAVAAEADPFVRVAFTLLLDTGARLSEVLRARWEDFDLDAGTWRIPSPKVGKPQAVPVLPETVGVVKATPRLDDGPFLLPGRNPLVHRFDLKKPWAALRTAAKLGNDVTIHDLRRTFGLRVTRSVGIFAASKLLRHADSRITEKVYAPLAPEDLRGFAERARILRFGKRKKAGRAGKP